MIGLFDAAGAETAVEQKAAWVVEQYTDASMSDLDKARALHDWLVDNAYYDVTFAAQDTFEAAGVLLNGTGVCDSYSKAYGLLLDKAGIESKRVTGTVLKEDGGSETHAWNIVKIGEKWYQVDVTWDDPVDPNQLTTRKSGLENHMYFMASKRFMYEEHIPTPENKALIDSLVGEEGLEELPEAVVRDASHSMPPFTLFTSSGETLTQSNFGSGKNLIMVYGRIACGNTRKFLSDIVPYIELLGRRDTKVLVALFDDPTEEEMKAFERLYPGIVCGKLPADDSDYSLWDALYKFGHVDEDGSISVVFPAIFLKNQQNKLTYCSTGYVTEPLKIIAGALEMKDDRSDFSLALPNGLEWIEPEAFRGCMFTSAELSEDTYFIDSYAFADNPRLKTILIPPSVIYISDTAFENCPGNLVIMGQAGSEAHNFAIAHGFTFVETE